MKLQMKKIIDVLKTAGTPFKPRFYCTEIESIDVYIIQRRVIVRGAAATASYSGDSPRKEEAI